jgi:hypothetical protein
MPSTSRPPAVSIARLLALGALAVLSLGACRADSVIAPDQATQPICETTQCDQTDAPAPGASIVIDPLEDAVARIVPNMLDTRARADLPVVLNALREALLAGRMSEARMQLARSYDALELAGQRLSGSGDAALVLDMADLSAIRLALVPASAALGVAAQ